MFFFKISVLGNQICNMGPDNWFGIQSSLVFDFYRLILVVQTCVDTGPKNKFDFRERFGLLHV